MHPSSLHLFTFDHPLLHGWYSVAQSRPTLYNPVDHSRLSFPVLHCLPKFAQAHVHWVGDTIQPSLPLSSPSPPALNLYIAWVFFPVSQFFASGGQSIGASASASPLPMNILIHLFPKPSLPTRIHGGLRITLLPDHHSTTKGKRDQPPQQVSIET